MIMNTLLFSAHSPFEDALSTRYHHWWCKSFSLASLIKSEANIMPAFEHSHKAYEFVIPVTPIPFLLNESAVYFGEVGFVFPVQSGRTHGMKYELSNVSYVDIVIEQEYLDSFRWEGCYSEFNYDFRLTEELRHYLTLFQKEADADAEKVPHKLELLSALITVELINGGLTTKCDIRKPPAIYQPGIRAVAEYMNSHYAEPLTIEMLAMKCHLSPNYFANQFKHALGDTPQDYLAKLRIGKAVFLLNTTDLSLGEIALQSGFSHLNNFSAQFKRTFGVTPSEYRKVKR